MALGQPASGWQLLEQHARLPHDPGPAQGYATALLEARAQVAHAYGDQDAAQQALDQAWHSARSRGELYWQARVLVSRLAIEGDVNPLLRRRAERLVATTGAYSLSF